MKAARNKLVNFKQKKLNKPKAGTLLADRGKISNKVFSKKTSIISTARDTPSLPLDSAGIINTNTPRNDMLISGTTIVIKMVVDRRVILNLNWRLLKDVRNRYVKYRYSYRNINLKFIVVFSTFNL